jgi:hypothetical protein
VGFISTHSEKCDPSPKHVFRPSSLKFLQACTGFDFETRSGGLELSNGVRILLTSTLSTTMPPTSKDRNPAYIMVAKLHPNP